MKSEDVNWYRAVHELKSDLYKEFPKLKIMQKDESFMHKLWGFVIRDERYMTHTATVIWNTIWMPTEVVDGEGRFRLLLHEREHLRQMRRDGKLRFIWRYSAPVGFYVPWLLLSPVLLLLSWPWLVAWLAMAVAIGLGVRYASAPKRVRYEVDAYTTNLTVMRAVERQPGLYIDRVIDNLQGAKYLWALSPKDDDMWTRLARHDLEEAWDNADRTSLGLEVDRRLRSCLKMEQ